MQNLEELGARSAERPMLLLPPELVLPVLYILKESGAAIDRSVLDPEADGRVGVLFKDSASAPTLGEIDLLLERARNLTEQATNTELFGMLAQVTPWYGDAEIREITLPGAELPDWLENVFWEIAKKTEDGTVVIHYISLDDGMRRSE